MHNNKKKTKTSIGSKSDKAHCSVEREVKRPFRQVAVYAIEGQGILCNITENLKSSLSGTSYVLFFFFFLHSRFLLFILII